MDYCILNMTTLINDNVQSVHLFKVNIFSTDVLFYYVVYAEHHENYNYCDIYLLVMDSILSTIDYVSMDDFIKIKTV